MAPKKLTPKQEAASTATAPERLVELAQDSKLTKVVAANPAAPPDLLESLSHTADKAIRKALVANPSTPPHLLMEMGSQFPEQLLENPVFDLLLLENPGLLDQWPRSTVASLLKRETVPEGFLRLAAKDADRSLLLSLLVNPQVPADVLAGLVVSADAEVAQAAQLHINAPDPDTAFTVADGLGQRPSLEKEDLRLKLAALGSCLQAGDLKFLSDRDREGLARYPGCPAAVLAELACDEDYAVRYSVARNPALPAALLAAMTADSHWLVLQILADHPTCTPEVLEVLAAREDWQVQMKVAGHPGCGDALRLQLLNQLASATDPDVRAAVVMSSANLDGVFERFAADQEADIRKWIAGNPACPAAVLAPLAKDESVEVRRFLAGNPSCPPDLLEALAEDETIAVRESVAANPATPTTTLTRLAQEQKKDLRLAIARNPSTPVAVLTELAANGFSQVHLRIIGNPSCPAELQQSLADKLAAQSEWHPRLDAARYHRAPAILLRVLSADSYYVVREAVALRQTCPPEVLAELAKDRDASVRAAVALNRSTPVTVLEQLAKQPNATVLEKLAGNPSAPSALLQGLLTRDIPALRLAVAGNPAASEDLLLSLVDGAEPEVLAALAENPSCTDVVLRAIGRTQVGRLAAGSQPNLPRLLAFRSPHCPPEALAKHVRSRDWLERAAIASNPNTPDNALRTLTQDGNRLVRQAAIATAASRS